LLTGRNQRGEEPLFVLQILTNALLSDSTLIHDVDTISLAYLCNFVREDDRRFASPPASDIFHDLSSTCWVQAARNLIEYQYWRILQSRPRQRYSLKLSAAEGRSTGTNNRLQAVRQASDSALQQGQVACLCCPFFGYPFRVGSSQRQCSAEDCG
jgi:hypothetical protein